MSANSGRRATRKAREKAKKARNLRRSAAAAGALLLVPAVAAGEPVFWAPVQAEAAESVSVAKGAGAGLMGLRDPNTVGADGSMPESTQLDQAILDAAGSPDLLAFGAPMSQLPNGPMGIPGIMLEAYMKAAQTMATTTPGCNLDWPLLASIGRIESNHARGGKVDVNGRTAQPILGPVLNGGGFAAISDTDGGRYDGDARWDRAVGPMQFIPSTWRGYASDGNGDGQTDPNNVWDAALGSARYLCSGGMNMANPSDRAAAVFRYNHSNSYVRQVLLWADAYAKGVTPLPTTPVPEIQQMAPPPVLVAEVPAPPPVTTTPPPHNPDGGTSPVPSGTTTTTPPASSTTTPEPTTTEPTTTTGPTTTTPTCSSPTPTSTPAPTTTPTPTPDPCATETPAPTSSTTPAGASDAPTSSPVTTTPS